MNKDYAYCVGPNYFGGPTLCQNCKRHIPFCTEVPWIIPMYDDKTHVYSLPESNKRELHLMIDIETLGRRNDAAITEIGVVAFHTETGVEIASEHIRIAPEHWNTHHRTFTGQTLIWWMTTNQQNIIKLEDGTLDYKQALDKLTSFILEYISPESRVWAKGPMDLSVLKSLYEEFGETTPWEFWQPRDMRTLTDLPGWEKTSTNNNTHNALEDARMQTKELIKNIEKLFSKAT